MRSQASFLAEMLVLGAAFLALIVWVIPAQTSEGGFGLSPAFLPTTLAIVLLVLVLGDGALRLLRPREEPAYPAGFGALARVLGVSVIGTLALRFGGVSFAAAVTSGAGMLALGERKPLPILATVLGCGGAVWLVFGS
jgi:hypothetical protein